jgi:hypothetical protein
MTLQKQVHHGGDTNNVSIKPRKLPWRVTVGGGGGGGEIGVTHHLSFSSYRAAQGDTLGARPFHLGTQRGILLRPFVGDCQRGTFGALQSCDLEPTGFANAEDAMWDT